MFLLRMMFWMAVVVMLIPTGEGQMVKVSATDAPAITVDGAIGAAAATVSDMAGFCGRNADVCKTGEAAFEMFLAKAENAARLAYRLVAETRGSSGEIDADSAVPTRDAAHDGAAPPISGDTLTAGDREPEWLWPTSGA